MPFSHNISAMSPSHFNIQQDQQQLSHKYDQQFIHRSEDTLSHSSYHNIARLNMVSPLIHHSQGSSLPHSSQSLSTSAQTSSIYGYDSVNLNYPPSSSTETYQFSNNYQTNTSSGRKCLYFKY